MSGTKDAERLLTSWWQYFDYCFNVSPGAFVCESFWRNVIVGFVGLGVAAVLAGAWAYWSYRRKYAAAVREQWLRDQADESAIRELSWKGDTAAPLDMPDAELAARIRAAIDRRKQDGAADSTDRRL